MKTFAITLICLLLCACSREPRGLADYFPDSKGERRNFQVLVDGLQRGFYNLETRSINEDEQGTALFFLDPRHRDLLGNWHMVLQDERLSAVLPPYGLELELFRYPARPDTNWRETQPGFAGRCLGLEDVEVTAGRFRDAVHLQYRLEPEFLLKMKLDSQGRDILMELWLAPFHGPVRFKVGDSYEEELVERY